MKTPEILTKSVGVLQTNGWIQHDYADETVDVPPRERPCCGLGAINIACGNDPDDELDGEALDAAFALALYLGYSAEDLVEDDLVDVVGQKWNDAEGRTVDEVIAAFLSAAQAELEAGR